MKSGVRKTVSFVLIFILCISSIVAVCDSSAEAATVIGALFTDVTGEVDLSSIALQNLSSSAIKNTTTANKAHTLIVSLEGKNLVEEANGRDVADYAISEEGKRKDSALRAKQDEFLERLSALGISYTLKNRYTAVDNAVAIEVNTKYVSTIKKLSGVESVCLSETYMQPETIDMGTYASASEDEMDEAVKKAVANTSAVTNTTSVYKTGVYDSSAVMKNYGYMGQGSVVAIVDTGLDYTHNAFIWDEEHENKYSLSSAVLDKDKVANLLAKNDFKAEERSSLQGQSISVNDVYISQKVPFAYDYADNDADVYPSSSNHGTHVAGIVAGYDPDGYTDKDGNHVEDAFVGVAPAAQLVICKVFTDDLDDPDAGGAETEDILAALEDCILLGVDVINMSLGTSCGFSTTDDGDEEGEMLNEVYTAVGEAGISLVCAASNDYSAAYGGAFGTNLASNPDSGTVGSPSVFAAALSVASISGQTSPYMIANDTTTVYYEESSDQYNKYYDFADMMLGKDAEGNTVNSGEFEYVLIEGVGRASDYSKVGSKIKGKIALVERGDISFKDKVEIAKQKGAIGIIVYNNVSGIVRMALGEVEDPIPSCCVSMEIGREMASYAKKHGYIGKIKIDRSLKAGPFMSEFSSWGPTPDLKLKPEVTAHGGEITSAVPGGYGEQSGTSMASPNMAGVVSIIRSYLKATQPSLSTSELTQRINQLIMSTATIVRDQKNLPYSPRKQGSGLGSLDNAISTKAYLYTDDESIDYRPKVNLGDDPEKKGYYDITFKIKNFGDKTLSFELNPIFMTEQLAVNNLAVAEQAYLLDDIQPILTVNGDTRNDYLISIDSGAEAEITVRLTLSAEERNYIETSFVNGMYVEGFINLVSTTDGQCDLNLPFLGYYGDWTSSPMLDYDAYEIDEAMQDSSIKDEDKPQASIWATQPYTTYYHDTYSMPMGSFAYLQDENASRKIYTTQEHNAVSCYDDKYGINAGDDDENVDVEDEDELHYLTTYEFRGLYIGLMRGARKIVYTLKNDATGELIYENTAYRINKAYSGGGSATPGFLKFELNPLEYGLVSNGKYRMDFEFYGDYGDENKDPDDTFSFTFYADYEAPSLRDVRVRFQDEKDGNKVKQRIYLDMDVYDNHYTQAALLCYFDSAKNELNQVTDYVVPFYNCTKNSVNTVSIEITDIYEQYKGELYVQFDDYALNHAVYKLDLTKAASSVTPDTFELASGEEEINLDIYETHKVSLIYNGDVNLSNFTWGSDNKLVADVRNGEIVGLGQGSTTITVSSNGTQRNIKVNVSSTEKTLSTPSISFSTIVDADDRLSSGSSVSLYPDQDVTLTVETNPWWYPKDKLKLTWKSTKEDVVSVDENGKLDIKKKGSASITATVLKANGTASRYSTTVTINALDPFVISGYSLSKYRGKDKIVEIPDDKMIMYIGEDAFEDNSTMEEVIIPKTVININKGAFKKCTALKNVYLVSREQTKIPDADLKIVYSSAFEGCSALELIDLTNVKVITLGTNALKNCTSLREIKNMKAIGTAFSNAFENCTSLISVDLTGMQVAGTNVFKNCTSLSEVLTGQFTDIGDAMFVGCKSLKSIELNNSKVGAGAFSGCSKLSTVMINGVKGENFVIGDYAFSDSALKSITFGEDCTVSKIGYKAFSNTKLTKIVLPNGLTEIGASVFAGTSTLKKITLPASFSFENIKLAGSLLGTGMTFDLADESQYTIKDGILYSKDMTTLYAVIDSTITSVEIPSQTTKIYDYAFAKAKITEITIPETVTSIGAGAFSNASSLVSITINAQISEIKADTFNGTSLISITLPSSVKKIGDYAFANTPYLASVDLNGVEEIGAYAFYNSKVLAQVKNLDSLNKVGDYAFANCQALDTIEFVAVKDMGECVFAQSTIKTVIFGDDCTTMGEYTFINATSLTSISIGSGITEIGEYAFMGCTSLESVAFGGVETIGDYAFVGCSKLKTADLSLVEEIGEMAFYNCNSLDKVDISSAKVIGNGAFCIDNGKGGINEITLAVADEIGIGAFEGTSITAITLPATLKTLGYGSVAYTSKLAQINVAGGNLFFVEDGVLYKNLSDGTYELMAYPSTKKMQDGVYVVKDGTIRIDAYAFAGVGKDKDEEELGVTKVVLPYSLTNIGDSAFYESGITEYTFNGLNAPVLETVYKYEVEEIAVQYGNYMIEPAINAYYYSNFDSLFIYYTDLITRYTNATSPLKINRPSNGVGYDSYVYSKYFGTVKKTDIVEDNYTKEFLDHMEKFDAYTDDVLTAWENAMNSGNITEYYKAVEEFSNIVKEARRLYGNVSTEQYGFISDETVATLTNAENRMRAIKKAYGIQVKITQIVPVDGSYKKNYVAGETFDMTGIVVIRKYDDGSTETVDSSKLVLLSTSPLKYYNQTVTIKDTETGEEFTARVYVSETAQNENNGSSDGDGEKSSLSGGMIALYVCIAVVGAGLIAGAIVLVIIAKKKKALAVEKAQETNENDNSEEESDSEDAIEEEIDVNESDEAIDSEENSENDASEDKDGEIE